MLRLSSELTQEAAASLSNVDNKNTGRGIVTPPCIIPNINECQAQAVPSKALWIKSRRLAVMMVTFHLDNFRGLRYTVSQRLQTFFFRTGSLNV
jgi:hypothetical protein